MSGARIIEGAKEALAVARGEEPAARITINGHSYVPEINLNPDTVHVVQLLEAIARHTQAGNRNVDQMVKDLDLAGDYARSALKVLRTIPKSA